MVSFILPGNSATGGYEVANSCRLQGTGDYFYRTNSSATNTYTFSAWIKKTDPVSDGNEWFFSSDESGFMIRDTDGTGGDQFHFYNNSNSTNYYSGALRRDVASWYNVIFSSNSGTGTIYVNGVVDKDSITVPNLGTANNGFVVGKHPSANSQFFGGYMAEVVFIEGSALDHTSFGEFDSDSGIWKPKDVSGLTFGTNGFYLDFEDSSALGNDVSGNNNDLTFNGSAINQSIDTCTNNFAVMNPLAITNSANTFSEGNLKITTTSGASSYNQATIGVSTGKWFWEVKYVSDTDGSGNYARIGIADINPPNTGGLGETEGIAYEAINGRYKIRGSATTYGDTYAPGDIIGVALNLDDNELIFYKNGTAQNSGTAIDISSYTPKTGFWHPAFNYDDGSNSGVFEANFGSPSFSISSGNADGNGYGNFEYSVPANYYSLCSKNLAEYG